MSGPWEDYTGGATDEAAPWEAYAPPAQPEPAQPTREPTMIDNVPGLGAAERGYEAARNYMLQEPQPGQRSLMGEPEVLAPVSKAIRAAGDFVIPETLPGVAGSAAAGYVGGKVLSPIVEYLTSSFRAMRPLVKEKATEAIGKLLPDSAKESLGWYKAAEALGPQSIDLPLTQAGKLTQGQIGARTALSGSKTLTEMQATLQEMRMAREALLRQGRTAAAAQAKKGIAEAEDFVESAFPGFKAANKGYAQAQDIGRLQQYTEATDPLKAFEKDLAKGRVLSGEGEELIAGGPRAAKFLKPDEIEDVRGILAKLGKEPGDKIWHHLLEGRALGGLVGAGIGAKQGGAQGAAEGAVLGLGGPKAINWMITQGLKNPATRAFLKRSLDGGGIANPNFWRAFAALGTRQGLDMAGGFTE